MNETSPNHFYLRIRRDVAWFVAVAAPVCLLLVVFPQIDLAVSGWFYDAASGRFASRATLEGLRDALHWPVWLAGAGVLLSLLARAWRGRYSFGLGRSAIAYLLLTALLGPVLLANVVLKDQWGRARPAQIEAFGGDKRFTPALVYSSECPRNCAFVSGEASMAFAFAAFGFLAATARRRRAVFAAVAVYGAVTGLVRIAQGAHFLSDVVFAAVLMIAVAWGLHDRVVERADLDRLAARWRLDQRIAPVAAGWTAVRSEHLAPAAQRAVTALRRAARRAVKYG